MKKILSFVCSEAAAGGFLPFGNGVVQGSESPKCFHGAKNAEKYNILTLFGKIMP